MERLRSTTQLPSRVHLDRRVPQHSLPAPPPSSPSHMLDCAAAVQDRKSAEQCSRMEARGQRVDLAVIDMYAQRCVEARGRLGLTEQQVLDMMAGAAVMAADPDESEDESTGEELSLKRQYYLLRRKELGLDEIAAADIDAGNEKSTDPCESDADDECGTSCRGRSLERRETGSSRQRVRHSKRARLAVSACRTCVH